MNAYDVIRKKRFGLPVDAQIIGEAVREMGGGRFKAEDSIDPAVGVVLGKKRGEKVAKGDVLLEIHAPSEDAARAAGRRLSEAIRISPERITKPPLFLENG